MRFFKDDSGKVVIGQGWNYPIGAWFIFMVLARLLPDGGLQRIVDLLAFGCISTWAWLEIFYGVNYFRRLLGLVVITIVIVGRTNVL